MIDRLCTPMVGGWWSVLRYQINPVSFATAMTSLTGTARTAISETVLPERHLIAALVSSALRHHTPMVPATDDATIAWHLITTAAMDIGLRTYRTGGLTLAVCRDMYIFLFPFQPTNLRVSWVIDDTAPPSHALVTYHGMSDADGGHPCQDNGDGTVTLYTVHALDHEYYRAVAIAVPNEDDKTVYLNWSR